MTESIDRRRFMGKSLAAAIALEIAASTSLAASTVESLLAQADPRILPAVPAPPVEQNAYYLLEQLAESVTESPPYDPLTADDWEYADAFSRLKPDPKRDERLGKWADENPEAQQQIELALEKPFCEYPREEYSEGLVDKISAFRSLARLMTVHATRTLSLGKCADAARIVELSADAFRRLRLGGGVYVDYLVVSACEFSLRPLLLQIAVHPGCSEDTLRAMLAAHPVDAEAKAGVTRSLQAEYCLYFIPELAKLSKCDPKDLVTQLNEWVENLSNAEEHERATRLLNALIAGHPHPFDAEETARLASRQTIAVVADLDSPWKEHREQKDFRNPELAAWPEPLGLSFLCRGDLSSINERQIAAARKALLGVHNPVGKKLIESAASAIDSKTIHRLVLSQQARYDGIRILLALAIYEKRHGKWPKGLGELCDEGLLASLPVDAFSGEAYPYSAKDRAVWSVGPDGDVSPSASEADSLEAEEYIWRLPACD